MAHAGERSLK